LARAHSATTDILQSQKKHNPNLSTAILGF
jgi:hypothetical protein